MPDFWIVAETLRLALVVYSIFFHARTNAGAMALW